MNQEILQAYLRQEETPAYIFDLDMLKSRVQMMKTILGERAEICFAMKANPFLIGPLKDTADKFEVCSPGEFHICETVGIPMERIVLSGVNKEKCDITHAMHTYGYCGKLAKNTNESADMPRQEAKKIISLNNVNRQEFSYTISLEIMNSMKEEFLKWINAWKYGKGDSDLKAKVLFINLFNTEKRDNYLELLATGRSFRTPDIQLDHMEADNINHSAEEKYFKPKNIGEQRNVYTDTIGNFMILDSKDNNNKDNRPLEMALEFYDNMSPHHWMIEEVRELLQDDRYSKSEGGSVKYRVPVEEFFTERRNRLLKYFTAILSRKLNDEKMPFA